MREIKFRAWDKLNKEMFNVESINFSFLKVYRDIVSYRKFNDIELMQYTGLKDKNNKEIYEGDIVKLRNNHGMGVVKYYDEWGAFVIEYTKPKPLVVLGMNYYIEDIKILGNIYENSELLGDKNDF
ncbi:YopX family protein [Fusobacterium polymorphum]|uniref:YopX protein domain-containing protein n=1 Tax=Fusobacterium nucleatum subsp. polymorphum TaxID=76857 RepID=A0A2C6BMC9_FUSNP|nr:YopX family protein [Fusobacterium polymorphum]PHI05727.1 hypothetical protein CBG54_00940 [Fusobacterium polymorphum]